MKFVRILAFGWMVAGFVFHTWDDWWAGFAAIALGTLLYAIAEGAEYLGEG